MRHRSRPALLSERPGRRKPGAENKAGDEKEKADHRNVLSRDEAQLRRP